MSDSAKEDVRAFALGLPGAWEDHPWGESAIKVGKKVFAFLGVPGAGFGMGVKLPDSGGAVLAEPFARLAGYGLGKSGWVEMTFGADEEPPLDLLLECVLEGYRAVAPKALVKELDARSGLSRARPARLRGNPAPVGLTRGRFSA